MDTVVLHMIGCRFGEIPPHAHQVRLHNGLKIIVIIFFKNRSKRCNPSVINADVDLLTILF
jgi:hypothetical protein